MASSTAILKAMAAAVLAVLVVLTSFSGRPAMAAEATTMPTACKDCAAYCGSQCSGINTDSAPSCSGICRPAPDCAQKQKCMSDGLAQCTRGCRGACYPGCGSACDGYCNAYCSDSCRNHDYQSGCTRSCSPSPQQCHDRIVQQCNAGCTGYCNSHCVKA